VSHGYALGSLAESTIGDRVDGAFRLTEVSELENRASRGSQALCFVRFVGPHEFGVSELGCGRRHVARSPCISMSAARPGAARKPARWLALTAAPGLAGLAVASGFGTQDRSIQPERRAGQH
jgi:hypothetical protein